MTDNDGNLTMKIGIFTLPPYINIGGMLQVYALQTLLERNFGASSEVKLINRNSDKLSPERNLESFPWWKFPFSFGKRLMKKIFVDSNTILSVRKQWKRQHQAWINGYRPFLEKYIHSDYYNSIEDINEDSYEIIVVGSDQIWRPVYLADSWGTTNPSVAFLSFAKDWNIKRYAYAASFGVDRWEFPTEKTAEYAALASKFLAVSVREDTGVKLCHKYLGIEAKHVLDPTMVLEVDDYMRLVTAADLPESPGNLFCYILDSNINKTTLINKVAKGHSLIPFQVNNPGKYNSCSYFPIESWLKAFHDAEFVITDSFHGCAFSIIFGKPFIAVGNVARGLSRMQSLMQMFGLEEHLISDVSQYDPRKRYEQPESVGQKLNLLRSQATDFIAQIR